jgi:Neprosin
MRFHTRAALSVTTIGFLAAYLATTALAQQERVECVKRSATATPPPHPPGPRRAASKKGPGAEPREEAAPRPQPVCPEGEVPVIGEQRLQEQNKQVPMKGNPLLRPRSGVESPSQAETKGVAPPSDVRTFKEIYGKPGKGSKGSGAAPRGRGGALPRPAVGASCAGVPSFGTCYYYGSAGLTRAADGAGMTMSVNRPVYDDSGGAGHSLDEIAVQGGPKNGNIVELGWLVSTDQSGDADPHIFVFHWKNWQGTCYNGCGWQQYSNTYYPGQNIGSLVGREIYIGYVFWKGNWWAWFDNQWIGYFPGSEWNNGYTKSALIQWFGEVSSENGVPPKTQMGDGILPPLPKAAHMLTLCDVDAAAWICWYRDQQSLTATVPNYYDIQHVGSGDTRYGGPGQ